MRPCSNGGRSTDLFLLRLYTWQPAAMRLE
jgi:hypothetical protein